MVDHTLNLRMMAAQNLVIEVACRNCHRKATMAAGALWGFFRKEWHLEEMPFRCDGCQSLDVEREAKEWQAKAPPRPDPPVTIVRRL